MKMLNLFLCFIILFLVATPSIELCIAANNNIDACCNEECSAPSDEDESKKENNNCNGNFCNPFAICCAGVLHFISSTPFTLIKPDSSIEHQHSYNTLAESQFSFDFWQPPKLI